MLRRFLLVTLIFILYSSFVIPDSKAQQNFIFSRNLRIGDNVEDVKQLQKILNSYSKTIVSNNGYGSFGNETTYFGKLTLDAVIRFQNLYREEIVGNDTSFVGTGYVGPLTRKKLNELTTNNKQQTTNTQLPENQNQKFQNSDLQPLTNKLFLQPPQVLNFSKIEAAPGDTVEITGWYFTKNNSIYFYYKKIVENLESSEGKNLKFIVPSSVELGKYNIWIENERGNSRNQIKEKFFTVTPDPTNPPTFNSTSVISVSSLGDVIILRGDNFESSNEVWSSLGNLGGVVSNGGEIKIHLSDFPKASDFAKAFKYLQGQSIDLYFFVKNSHGVTLNPQKVILRIN